MNKKVKLAYLFLGIGIGIIFVNVLYSFYPQIKYMDIGDDIIIERARELGMVNLKESINMDNLKDELIEEEEKEEVEEPKVEIKIVVESGSSLTSVARKLYRAELIEDMDEFILFVKEKKLDKKIITGEYKIESGSSYDEIIETLTRRPD